MDRIPQNPNEQLEASLRRMRGALYQSRNQYTAMIEQIMAATGAEVAERVTERLAERHERRMRKLRRKAERLARQESERASEKDQHDGGELPRAVVFAAAALTCLVMAVLYPGLFWMVFPAFGLGMGAATSLGRGMRARRLEREARQGQAQEAEPGASHAETVEKQTAVPPIPAAPPVATAPAPPPVPAEPLDPKVTRIQSLCDKLLAELESGPPIVREVVNQPQATIGGLRQACLEIARRERDLRSVLDAQEERALIAERDALTARIASEQDQIVRDRLGQALRALEEQLAHRAELNTAAARLDAENTRILYTLESLHMQLLRARSTDIGAPELGGKLRESLRELGTEIDAVAEALEFASAPASARPPRADDQVAQTAPEASDARPTALEDAQRERQAAARRASQARDAQQR